jgi:5-formyltetrahydrofolate cyclo-ligase
MRRAMPPDSKALKRELRAVLIAARARLGAAERLAASEAIAGRLAGLESCRSAATVGLYASLGTEVDSAPISRAVQARGGRVAFPRTVPGQRRLVFCACRPEELVRGPLGAGEPPPGAREVPLSEIACFVIPGVGFSRDGLRLGRGGGYYDVTLKEVPEAARLGVGFALQVVAALPREPHDVPLDAIVTEHETLLIPRQVT